MMNIQKNKAVRNFRPSRPQHVSPWLRSIAFALALCFFWTFMAAGVAAAAHERGPEPKRPRSLWMSPAQKARMQAQAQKVKAMQAHAAKPGFPYRQAAAQAALHPSIAVRRSAPITLLDQVGLLTRPVPAAQVASWYAEKGVGHVAPARAALLNLWMGEWELAHNQHPQVARPLFRQARILSRRSDSLYGLASYDDAIALFYEGDYAEATAAFSHLVTSQSGLGGYDRRDCALWLRHASACNAYHVARAKLGIPEPPRLDPLCGVAALAACLRSLGMPFDKQTLLHASHVTGEGNNMSDVADAAKRLGASAYSVSADEHALMQMPLPMVAYVEHDHFVALVRADKSGVSYLCADCGPWPGGRINLSWAQWRQMNPGLYLAVTKPGSEWDKRIATAQSGQPAPIAQVAMADFPGKLSHPLLLHIGGQSLPKGAVVYRRNSTFVQCGGRFHGLRCMPAQKCSCPEQSGGGHGGSGPGHGKDKLGTGTNYGPGYGPAADDPVNLASGEEEYTPTDLTVYNPHGPSIVWGRIYDSLAGDNTSSPQRSDFGDGWSQTYNVGVLDTNNSSGNANLKYVYFANGSRLVFTAPAIPNASTPSVLCTAEPGAQFSVLWNYDTKTAATYFAVAFADRSQWVTAEQSTTGGYFLLSKKIDRNGNYLSFNYTTTDTSFPLLSTITNQDGTILLSILRVGDGTGNIAQITDCYGRSIFYHVEKSTYAYDNFGLALDRVSQIVPTGTLSPPDRYIYGYLKSRVPEGYNYNVLHTITVPSPTGTGTSTAYINYNTTMNAPDQMLVSSLVDGNGNVTSFSSVDSSGNPSYGTSYTQVTFTAPGASVPAYSYIAGYDNHMCGTSKTDGQGRIISTSAYDSTSVDPYGPTAVADGNGNISHYVWDQFGNMHQSVSPRGTVTNYTYAFPSGQVPSVVNSIAATGAGFPLGEKVSVQQGSKMPTAYAYIEPSGLISTITMPQPGATGTGPMVTFNYTYDYLGNQVTATTPGDNAVSSITTTYNYSSDGSYSQAAAIGQPLTSTDNLGNVTHFRYDNQGNLAATIDAVGNETDCSYTIANLPATVTFSASGQTGPGRGHRSETYLYAGGPLVAESIYDENGNAINLNATSYGNEGETLSKSGSQQPASLTYDACYRIRTVKDGNNNVTRYYYNRKGYLDSVTYPGYTGPVPIFNSTNGSWDNISGPDSLRYPSYDDNGDILQRIDGRGIVTNYQYSDAMNKLTDILYPASSSLNVHFTYDTYGRKASMSDSTGTTSGTYDDLSQPLTVSRTYTGLPIQAISYSYYPNGCRKALITPAGTFSYSYDGDGRMSQLTNPNSEVSSWQYLNNGWLRKQTLNNGVGTLYTYNQLGEITELNTQTSSGTLLSDFSSMAYDGLKNRMSITTSLPAAPTSYSGITAYTYDAKFQISQEQSTRNGSYTNHFVYDGGASSGAGNSTSFKGTTHSYNTDNQDTSNIYDGSGNPTTYNSNPLSFDPENRLTSAAGSLSAGYTGEGLRAWKQPSGGGKTYFLYDGNALICELSNTGSVIATNTYGVNGLLSRNTTNGSVFYSFDPQGSIAQRLDGSANVLSSDTYDCYGSRLSTASGTDVFGFGAQAGYYTDGQTGLILCTHRYYNPQTGRFLTRDPFGLAGGVNLYEYGCNNPVNRVDPMGYWASPVGPGLFGCAAQLLGQAISNDDSGCKFLIGCGVALAVAGLIGLLNLIPGFQGPLSACIGNAVGALVGALLMHDYCETPCEQKENLQCDISNAAIAAGAGCLQGLFVEGLPEGATQDITDAVFSLVGGGTCAEMDQCANQVPG